MNFVLRDISTEVNGLNLSEIEKEIAGHKAVLPKVTNQKLRVKIENNIIVLQMKKIELIKQAS